MELESHLSKCKYNIIVDILASGILDVFLTRVLQTFAKSSLCLSSWFRHWA